MSLSTPSPAWEQVEEQFVMTKAGSVEGTVGVITHRYYDADLVDAARAADASQIEELEESLNEARDTANDHYRTNVGLREQVAALSAQVEQLRKAREAEDLEAK